MKTTACSPIFESTRTGGVGHRRVDHRRVAARVICTPVSIVPNPRLLAVGGTGGSRAFLGFGPRFILSRHGPE